MASRESESLSRLFSSWNERRAANQNDPIAFLRSIFSEWGEVTAEAPGVWFESVDSPIAGIRAVPTDADSTAAILYIHGGGYIGGGSVSHRKLAAHFAKAIGAAVFVPDYRLAPEHRFPAPLDDVRAAFDWLVESGIEPSRIIVAGDSAGGALATALALQLRDTESAVPGAVVTLSAYYDTEGLGESFDTNIHSDLLSGARGRAGIQANVAMFIADEAQRTHPYVAALRADARGLPPHFLSAGGAELLVDGVAMFAQKLADAGVEHALEIVPEMQHVFQLMAGRAPEADASIQAIARFVRSHVPINSMEPMNATA